MGNIFKGIGSKPEVRIVMVGLDSAGKTTILYKMKGGNELANTTPTVGFNVETFKYKNIKFTMWDVGGQDRLRNMWNHYYQGSDAVVFVVDSGDPERAAEARDELAAMMSEPMLSSAIFLVLANKQDLPNALSLDQIKERLGLDGAVEHTFHIQGTHATKAKGLTEGFDWLSKQIKQKIAAQK